jgi:hypothetical protein
MRSYSIFSPTLLWIQLGKGEHKGFAEMLNQEINGKLERIQDRNVSDVLLARIHKQKDNSETNVSVIQHLEIGKMSWPGSSNCLVNLEPMNNFRRVNKVHEHINRNMVIGDIYTTCVETIEQRKFVIRSKYPPYFAGLILFVDFWCNRVLHKLPIINSVYFVITSGKNRPISKAESIGRLISCGFDILDLVEDEGLVYLITRKVRDPYYDDKVSFRLIFNVKRIGYQGKLVSFYKIRTMHPFSEYAQAFLISRNKLNDAGKVSGDYRVTAWGSFLRKYWIDEIPMIINLLKGDLNLVGVRPLSQDFFNRYPVKLQELRIQVKPGLIPPYYADMPSSISEVLESEKHYIEKKLLNPFRTDWIYFWKALQNIVFNGARSA